KNDLILRSPPKRRASRRMATERLLCQCAWSVQARGARLAAAGAPVRLIDFENAARHPDIGALKFDFKILELDCGNAVIHRAQKQQRHRGFPREADRL